MPFTLIKGRFKPAIGLPDGDSVRFLASSPAIGKKLDGNPVRLGISDKSKHIVQVPSLESIEAIKTTTSNMNWFLSPFLSPLVVGLLSLTGCGDPLTELINAKWPPIKVEQQRQAAIDSTASALETIIAPNVALAVKLSDAQKVLFSEDLKKQGVAELEVEGDKQLLRLQVKFNRQFTDKDAGDNANLRKILATLKPEASGSITVFAGLTGALSIDGAGTPALELRLLPALSAVKVEKITLTEKLDATTIGEALAGLLNKYKDNISGELSRSPLTKVIVPALEPKPLDLRQTMNFKNAGTAVSVEVQSNPVVVPFKLAGVAWLITDDQIISLVQLSPLKTIEAAQVAAVEKSFGAIKERILGMVTHSFAVPDADSTTWVAVRKDLVAAAMNSAVSQAKACVAVSVDSPKQHTSDKIRLPSGDKINCSSSRDCTPQRQCSFNSNPDTTNCWGCLIPSPQICAWGHCLGGGGCVKEGNLPVCEAQKLLRNTAYNVAENLRKADCDRLRETERATCDIEKIGEKGLCEMKKGVLNAIAATGNFANVDTDTQFKTNGLRVCLRDFTLAPDLDKVQFALDVSGEANADIDVKFTPLDIVGHLTCQFPWKKSQSFKASLRDSRLGISSSIAIVTESGKTRADFAVDALLVKAQLQPTPAEYLLNSPEMLLSCPITRGIAPLAVALAPFVKELRGELDYTLPTQQASVELLLPTQQIGNKSLSAIVKPTPKALVVMGTLVDSKWAGTGN